MYTIIICCCIHNTVLKMKNYNEEIKEVLGNYTKQLQTRIPEKLSEVLEKEAQFQKKSSVELLREIIVFYPPIAKRLLNSMESELLNKGLDWFSEYKKDGKLVVNYDRVLTQCDRLEKSANIIREGVQNHYQMVLESEAQMLNDILEKISNV